MKFGFVVKHRATWLVPVLCEAPGVSRSGSYPLLCRGPSARASRHAQLGVAVHASFLASDRAYGARRVWHDVLDLFSRRVVGWAMQSEMTTQLVTDALMMAVWRRGHGHPVLHHSDRGSQYTAEAFQRLLHDLGVTSSMSRAGNVWDNSAMESFFSSLKTERTNRRTYRTRNVARADVFDYIERFYNPRRRHSTLGYASPITYEAQAQVA